MSNKLIPFYLKTIANFKNTLFCMFTCLLILSFADQVVAQAKLDFSHNRGFSDAPFNLTITPEDPSATIRYTLDGEEPSTTSGQIYNGSISVQSTTVLRAIGYIIGVDTSKVYTHTYLFIDDVINQPENITGWPNNNYDLGSGNGTARHDYEMDPAIVNSSLYNADVIQGLKDIPSMSIVLPRDDFWDVNDGNAEKQTSIELLYYNDPSENEQEDGGIEPHSHDRLKRSFRISFKSIYGARDWDSDIFQNAVLGSETAENEFDRIVLRAGNNRAWSRNWNTNRTAFTRDEWARQSQIASSGIGAHGTFVHLYINGLYWGLYNPVERPDESFTSTYLGGEKEDWFAVSHGGDQGGIDDRYDFMINTVLNRDLNTTSNYEDLKMYLDVEKFSDYLLIAWMTGVQDWPHNNWWGGNRNSPAGPFMFFGWDNEWSWDVTLNANNGAWVHPDFRSNDTGGSNAAFVFNKVKVNEDYMMTFADRVYKLCFNDGAMTDDNSRQRWSTLNNNIENAVVAESARWGDGIDDGVTRTRDVHWQNEVNRLDGLMDGNVQRLMNALLNEGYYPNIDPPLFENNGNTIEVQELSVANNFNIELVNPNGNGQIYYTTNGIDPRLSGGNIAPSAIAYSNEDIVITNATTLLARVKNGNEWSALHCLNLNVQQDLSWIKLTEIMYNPGDFGLIGGSELEFLEIKNTNNSLSLDISGLRISNGVEFTFPVGTIMNPQSFIVLASNAVELTNKCPGFNIFGEYEGQLSNGGEKIEFVTFELDTIIRVDYNDNDPWPIAADGEGHSLVSSTLNPVGSQDDSSFWKLSADNVCGSPLEDDEECIGPDSDNDGICDSLDACPNLDNNLIGTDCDDGDVCTVDDVYTSNCLCEGIFADADNDGICDADDDCDGNLLGQACDDGDVCTTGDIYDADCNCAGVYQDSDNDGICDAEDCVDGIILEEESFNNTLGSFTLVSGAFSAPNATYESFSQQNESIVLEVGGVDDTDQTDMSLGISTSFIVSSTEDINIEIDYVLNVSAGYDDGEWTQALAYLDGQALIYNGNSYLSELLAGSPTTTGTQIVTLTIPSPSVGTHTLTVGLLNNLKTFNSESSSMVINNISIVQDCPECDPLLVGQSCDDGDVCTTGETYDSNCNCTGGTFQDSDGDGVCDANDTCPESAIITENYGSMSTEKVEVTDFIIATNTVEANANVTYDAGMMIELQSGFEVEQAAVFHAFIDGCGNQ